MSYVLQTFTWPWPVARQLVENPRIAVFQQRQAGCSLFVSIFSSSSMQESESTLSIILHFPLKYIPFYNSSQKLAQRLEMSPMLNVCRGLNASVCVEIHEKQWAPFMCRLFVFVHPQMILKTGSQANRGSEKKDRQADKQAVRQAGRLRGIQELRGSEVNSLAAAGSFGLQGASLCSASSNNTTSSFYFSICCICTKPPAQPPLQWSLRLSDPFTVWQHKTVRLFQSSKLWKLSKAFAIAEQI